jgi:hypothetical protein
MTPWYPLVLVGVIVALVVWTLWSPPPPPDAEEQDCFGSLFGEGDHEGGAQ